MRLALVTPGFSASEDDWCIPALYDLVRELARAHDVHVFTLRYPYRQGRYPFHGATVHALGGATARGLGRLPLLGRALRAVVFAGRRERFDLVHGLWADEAGFVAVRAAALLGVPALVSLMGGELERRSDVGYGHGLSRAARWLVGHALHYADHVTVGSRFLAERAASHVDPARLSVLPLGVNLERFRPASDLQAPLAGGIRLLHVASLLPVKDQTTLLSAFARVAQQVPAAHLHLVGEGPARPSLEAQVARDGLAQRVTFHGALPHERLPAFYRAADLCVLASRYESQGMVVLEAAACGRATVGAAVGILPEIADPDWLVAPGDVGALADCIGNHLAHAEQLPAMGSTARARVRARYGLLDRVAALGQRYRTLLDPSLSEGSGHA